MPRSEPVYVDANQPADLRYGITHQVTHAFLTLQDAIVAYNKLPEKIKDGATIVLKNPYRIFDADAIERLHTSPKPEEKE